MLATAAAVAALAACQPQKGSISLEHQGDTLTIVHITNPSKYLILPIQESRPEGKVKLDTGSAADVAMDVRLAVDSVDYYVPFALPEGAKEATVTIGQRSRRRHVLGQPPSGRHVRHHQHATTTAPSTTTPRSTAG